MKKLFILLLIALVAACAPAKKEQANINGKIEGSDVKSVKLYDGRDVVKEFKLKEDGTFSGIVPLSDAAYYSFRVDREGAEVFLLPGETLTVNYKDADFTFAGTLAKECDFLKIKQEASNINYRSLFGLEEAEFSAKLDSMAIEFEKTLADYLKENKVNEKFAKLEKEVIKYAVHRLAATYGPYHGYFTQNREFKVSENFSLREEGLDLNKAELLPLPNYKNYVKDHLEAEVRKPFEGKEEVDEKELFDAKVKYAKEKFTDPKVSATMLFELVKEQIRYTGVKENEAFINEFKGNCKDAAKLDMIAGLVEKYSKTDVGAVAPDFTLKNLKGEDVTLSSLKGKMVVIDFWATWCGPCKVSFPGMQKATDKFKDVEFLYVNTWENVPNKKENAEKFMNDNGYNLNVLIDENNEVVASYNVSGIPTKYLIDKEGKIKGSKVGGNADADAIVKEIEEWINK